MSYALGIDLGGTSAKTVAVTRDGEVLAKSNVPFDPGEVVRLRRGGRDDVVPLGLEPRHRQVGFDAALRREHLGQRDPPLGRFGMTLYMIIRNTDKEKYFCVPWLTFCLGVLPAGRQGWGVRTRAASSLECRSRTGTRRIRSAQPRAPADGAPPRPGASPRTARA